MEYSECWSHGSSPMGKGTEHQSRETVLQQSSCQDAKLGDHLR